MPVIFDEVFTGLWRLGAPSGAALLGAAPDIACYAKLLTGGMVPLAATLAREEVFAAFQGKGRGLPRCWFAGGFHGSCWSLNLVCTLVCSLCSLCTPCIARAALMPASACSLPTGDTKAQALLHGHSYSAHPIGCAAGVAALQLYSDPQLNPNWCTPKVPGRCRRQQQAGGDGSDSSPSPSSGGGDEGTCCSKPCGHLLPLWDDSAVSALSRHPRVRSVVPLGTVLAVRLRSPDGAAGYASNAAAAVVARLRAAGVYGRPLGDVVYLMVTPMTSPAQCDALLGKLAAALE